MKAKPKKKKKSKDKLPPSPVPPEWEELVLDPDISLSDVFNNAEDTMALQVANKSSMEKLVKHAKEGDEKSFLDLIKIHTSASELKILLVTAHSLTVCFGGGFSNSIDFCSLLFNGDIF